MAIVTEAEIRERVRRPTEGMCLTFAPGTRFSPAAQDFLKQWQVNVRFEEAAIDLALADGRPATTEASGRPEWDRPGSFPVRLEGDMPTCSLCGQPVQVKPDHMTQIVALHFATKHVPRLRFRGQVDSLHGLCLLAQARARHFNLFELAEHLSTLAAYCREILSAEYNEREVASLELAGLDEAQLREYSQQPERHLGIEHIVPGVEDHEILLWLNYLRCQAREVEIEALQAFTDVPCYPPRRPDLARALNRFSSAVYYLELLLRAGKLDHGIGPAPADGT